MNDTALDEIPPIQITEVSQLKTFRQFQLRIPTTEFLRLELEAAKRGTTSYKLAVVIISMYLSGRLIIKPTDSDTTVNSTV